MAKQETVLERAFVLAVAARGGLAVKLQPTISGVPDRCVLWPGGHVSWVELKTETGDTRAIQIYRHRQMRALGHEVVVLSGAQEIQDWVDIFPLDN